METNLHRSAHPIEDGGGEPAVLLTIPQAAHRLAVGRSTLYLLIDAGELEVIHIGRAVRVPADAVDEFVARRRAAGNDRAGVPPVPSRPGRRPGR